MFYNLRAVLIAAKFEPHLLVAHQVFAQMYNAHIINGRVTSYSSVDNSTINAAIRLAVELVANGGTQPRLNITNENA